MGGLLTKSNARHTANMSINKAASALSFTAKCHCGKVEAVVQTLEKSPPLRLVCYCKDCRGYYETLSRKVDDKCHSQGRDLPASLDNWGGVDWMNIYPRDVSITHGQDLLTVCKIRDKSIIRQVYSTCCYTPMFRFGEMSLLVNTNVMVPQEGTDSALPPVTFRIIGRDAWKTGLKTDMVRPGMSSSVPFKWFWTMPFRIRKSLMEPMPMSIPKAPDCPVLEGFQEGSNEPTSP